MNSREREWKKSNPDKVRDLRRRYYIKNKDNILRKRKIYVQNNRDKISETNRAYREKNRLKIRINKRKKTKYVVQSLSNSYVKEILTHYTTLRSSDIPLELVAIKRQQILIDRLLREMKA